MPTKVLDNGKRIVTDDGNSKEIANKMVKDYKANPKIDVNNIDKTTADEISKQRINRLNKNHIYNQINSHVEKDENTLDELKNLDEVNCNDIANKICGDRSEKLPKSNLNLL